MIPYRSKSVSRRAPRRACAGWTLVEMMAASLAGGIILAALLTTSVFASRSFIAIGNYSDLDAASRTTLDYMTRDIRNAAALVGYATNSITLLNQDGTEYTYTWNPYTARFTRSDGSSTTTLLTGCDYLTFNIFQRNPTNNFQFAPATTINQTKLIDVSWRCSRKIFGLKINTESVQTAEIVIRS